MDEIDDDADDIDRLFAAFERTNPDGSPCYTDDEQIELCALFVVAYANRGLLEPFEDSVTPLDRFGKLFGADAQTPRPLYLRAMRSYLARNPLNPELMREFGDVVEDALPVIDARADPASTSHRT